MTSLRIENFRCIQSLSLDIRPVTLLMGRNATGKSSVAYAAYYYAKSPGRDPRQLLRQLYGTGLEAVARHDGGPVFPVVIEVEGDRFEARSPDEATPPRSAPWTDAYLLPSQRIGLFKVIQILPDLMEQTLKKTDTAAVFAFVFLFEIVKALPLVPPPLALFAEDLLRLYTGAGFARKIEHMNMGAAIEHVAPLLSLVKFTYEDPYTKIQLPLTSASDGATDVVLIDTFIEKAPRGSLVVVEEPEIHKNPVAVVELVKDAAAKITERGLTLLATTHSDLTAKALAKAVEEGKIRADDVAIYYLERDPWTKAKQIKIYQDGSIEELPDAEKVVTLLF